ncbi:MAG: PAS-domain containing protein [Sneathiella sp.]|nr:PAS-domain containing protein [Sneathiella sp.]
MALVSRYQNLILWAFVVVLAGVLIYAATSGHHGLLYASGGFSAALMLAYIYTQYLLRPNPLHSIQLLSPTLNSLKEAVILFDKRDRVIYFNETFRRLALSLPTPIRAGMKRTDFAELLHDWLDDEDSRLKVRNHYKNKNYRTDFIEEVQIKLPNGKFVSYSERSSASLGRLFIVRDVTDDVQKRKILQFQSDLLGAVYEYLPMGIVILDRDNHVISWNKKFVEITDVPEDKIFHGKPYRMHLIEAYNRFDVEYRTPEEFADAVIASFVETHPTSSERVLKNGRIMEIYRVTLKDGRKICTFTDVTLQRTSQRILKESEGRYRKMVELAPEAIFVHQDDIIIYSNEAAVNLIGARDLHDIIGQRMSGYFPLDDQKNLGGHFRYSDDTTAGYVVPAKTGRLIQMDGEYVDVELEGATHLYGDKPVMQVIVRNITAQKKTQELLQKAKEEAEYASQLKGNFLANMSHELRTPLNAVIGFSEIIKGQIFGTVGSEKYVEYAEDIHASGVHLLELINDILDLSKADAGTMEIYEEQVDLEAVVKICTRIAETQRAKAGVELSVIMPDTLPELRADRKMLKQVLLNLLSNSIKFTPSGGQVTLAVEPKHGGGLNIIVKDTGIGIKENDIVKALTPFVQVDSELGRKYQGTGLGLPLSKELVELHGGTLTLESEFGVGSTVTIYLPAERVLSKAA